MVNPHGSTGGGVPFGLAVHGPDWPVSQAAPAPARLGGGPCRVPSPDIPSGMKMPNSLPGCGRSRQRSESAYRVWLCLVKVDEAANGSP